jgi:hypothetical protein
LVTVGDGGGPVSVADGDPARGIIMWMNPSRRPRRLDRVTA